MACIAYYRLPDEVAYTRIMSYDEPTVLPSLSGLAAKSGFIFAPFIPSSESPILLFRPDEVSSDLIDPEVEGEAYGVSFLDEDEDRADYSRVFKQFHQAIASGEFTKLVLARESSIEADREIDAWGLFVHACQIYHHEMVTLVSSDVSGTWLTVTPELLLQGELEQWHTMALAGTQPASECDHWSETDRREQQLVTDFIAERLKPYSAQVEQQEPRIAQAGDLAHLCTDFYFNFKDDDRLGAVIDSLYPTPAVCGLPKEAARQFILNHETTPRAYYSGFQGPLNIDGHTNLFVTIRTMKLHGDQCRIYAGGGLLATNEEQDEWEETQAKMETMLKIFTDFGV